ncbi:MAG: hypothetical protein J6Z09_10105, partial [Lachnospiraceae bacterium]|nr:hypothetical protein [Lachnospiraceae bacterium]
MYEENNTTNNQDTGSTPNTNYGPSSYSNYNFNQGYQNPNGTPFPNTTPVPPRKEKKPGKVGGFFKKLILVAVLGVFFGACAGATFYGVYNYFGLGN